MEIQARISSFRFADGRLLARVQFMRPDLKAPFNVLENREIDVTDVPKDALVDRVFEHLGAYAANAELWNELKILADSGIPLRRRLPAEDGPGIAAPDRLLEAIEKEEAEDDGAW